MILDNEEQLAKVAASLIGDLDSCSSVERALIGSPADNSFDLFGVAGLERNIREGSDPLGVAFSKLRKPHVRRRLGATYTPKSLVDRVIELISHNEDPVRVVDPGAGSGRFLAAAAKVFPKAKLVAIEIDPLASLVLRANIKTLGLQDRTDIIVADYREISLPHLSGATIFVGNPPYVRHHEIASTWKTWFALTARHHGVTKASKLAGLHLHFFLKTLDLAKAGDSGAFLTAGEWLDVNYGETLRQLLAGRLGGCSIDFFDPRSQLFCDAMTSGVITSFHVDRRPTSFALRHIAHPERRPQSKPTRLIPWSDLAAEKSWSFLVRNRPKRGVGQIELGELFRVHRGQVTGNNQVWIAGPETPRVPLKYLRPTITRARELIDCGGEISSATHLRKVIDLPISLETMAQPDREAIDEFLHWARRHSAHESYIARHRTAWWSVRLYEPAPIVCTYMARRPPVFVRNRCAARHLNIALGLYPIVPIPDHLLTALVRFLQSNVSLAAGRVYSGGLTKFEPGEMQRVPVPNLDVLAA
jgi:hypothetical protein